MNVLIVIALVVSLFTQKLDKKFNYVLLFIREMLSIVFLWDPSETKKGDVQKDYYNYVVKVKIIIIYNYIF